MIKKNQNLAVFSRLCIFVSLILVGSSVTTFLPEITLIKHFMSEKHQGMLPNVIILEFQIWMYVFLKSLTYCIVNTSAVLGQIFVMFTPAFGFYDQPLVFLKSLYSNMFFLLGFTTCKAEELLWVTKKRNTKRLKHTWNLFRKNPQLKDVLKEYSGQCSVLI